MGRRLGAAGVLMWLALSALAAPALADCQINQIAELPVTMSGPVPLVPAKINGADVMFEADSGAFYSMISPSMAAEQKLRIEPMPWGFYLNGIGGSANAYLTTVKTFTLANTPIHNLQFIVASGVGDDVAGLLGQNVLGLRDVEYDLANGVIRLLRPDGCGSLPLAYWAADKPFATIDIKVPDEHDPHTLGVAYVNGARMQVMFDTGAWSSMMTVRAAARAGIKPGDADVAPTYMSHGVGSHLVRTWIAPIDDFKIDSEEIKHTRLRIADSDMIGVDMVLGADFFLSHRVYVSNLQHKLYLTYNGGPVFKLTEPAVAQAAPDATPQPPAPPTDLGPAPTDAEGFSRRGAALAARRQFDRAIADFTHACALAPTESRYFHQRATAYLENKQPDLAMADLDQTLKLNPDDIGARLERAELHLFKKDKAAAILDLDAAATLAAPQEDFRLHLAVLYERVDRLADAIAQYDLWIAAHEEDARIVEAFNGRCWDRTLIGTDLDKALKDCNRALSALPKSQHILDSRGLVFLRMGRFDKAINDYNAALAQDPHIAWSLYGRGLAELALCQKPAGQADIAAALVIDPKIADDFKRHGMVAPAQS